MSEPTVVELEMGYAVNEFGRVLSGVFTGETSPYRRKEIKSHHWAIEQPGEVFDLIIEIREKPPRKIAMLTLPVLQVIFTFTDTTESLREKFFHRFHQYFHKGGG